MMDIEKVMVPVLEKNPYPFRCSLCGRLAGQGWNHPEGIICDGCRQYLGFDVSGLMVSDEFCSECGKVQGLSEMYCPAGDSSTLLCSGCAGVDVSAAAWRVELEEGLLEG